MSFTLAVAATAFALIFPVEFPDKTFVATLVLATRYPPPLVWLGVSSAFLVQTALACTAGALLTAFPRTPIELASAVLFLVGGVVLLRGARQADAHEAQTEQQFRQQADRRGSATGIRAVGTSFLVLFLAEWGDLSQLLTAGLVVRYQQPLSVGVGAFLALATVSGLAALLGRALLRRVRLATIRRIGGGVCLVVAGLTVLGLLGVRVPVLG
ncbi:MAG: TMEM165/GDT1 family protein [Dermatophilaceae bacterium]